MKILKKSTLLLLSFVLVFMTSAAFFSVCAEDSLISSETSGGTSITAETVIVTTPKFSISVPTGIPIGDIAKTETTSIKSAPFTVSVCGAAITPSHTKCLHRNRVENRLR